MTRQREDLAHLSIFELTRRYEEAAERQGKALEDGNHKVANKQYDLIEALRRELRHRGNEGQAAILNLMKNASPWVRMSAAGVALRFAPDLAVDVLKALDPYPGALGLTAELILKQWRSGNIKFDE